MSQQTQIDLEDDGEGFDTTEFDVGIDDFPSPRPAGRLDPRRRIEELREERQLRQLLREVYEN